MNKNFKYTILGVATLLFALTLNFRHALDGYGVLDNKLHVEVLAQTNTTGGGDSSDTGNEGCQGYIVSQSRTTYSTGYYTITVNYSCTPGGGIDCRRGAVVNFYNSSGYYIGSDDKRLSVNCI